MTLPNGRSIPAKPWRSSSSPTDSEPTARRSRVISASVWPALFALAAGLFFALAAILLKRAFQHASPRTAAVFSVTFTAAFVLVVAATTVGLGGLLTWHVWPFVVAGIVAPGLARLVYYVGVHRVGASRASALASAQPLFAVAMAILFLGERPGWALLMGAVGVVAGGALLSTRVREEKRWRRLDLLFPLSAAVAFGFRDVISRYGFRDFDSPILAAAAATLTSVIVMWSFAALGGVESLPPSPGIWYLLLAGLCEGGAYLTMWRALATGDVSVVSPLVHAQPFFTVVLAAFFLRDLERVTWRIAVASVLIVGGVVLVLRFR